MDTTRPVNTGLASQPVLALTVRPPWSHWLATGIKTIENRTWAPPAGWRGQLVIHAGRNLDLNGFAIGRQLGHPVAADEINTGEYIAVATLADVHRAGQDCRPTCSPWGEPRCLHWVLANVRRLVTIEGRGRQRLFVPPTDVVEQALAG